MNFSDLNLPYDPNQLKRELNPFYIPLTDKDIELMLKDLGVSRLDQLFDHIPPDLRQNLLPMAPPLDYPTLAKHLLEISQKNTLRTSFQGDGLKQYKVPEIVPLISQIRGLTTAYTPYQPERAQGTLTSLWLYSCTLSMLTGFEAINASLYDRATCLFEALSCAKKLMKKATTALMFQSLYPGDREVVFTHIKETKLQVVEVPFDPATGKTNLNVLKKLMQEIGDDLIGVAFPQVNSLGVLEDVDAITDLCYGAKIKAISVVDPILLATGGLKPPAKFGSTEQGAHILVAEGQHLAIGPNFGGPGLGIFGIRYNDQDRISIRSTPGRFVGKATDRFGQESKAMVLSTREQHIRRDKATSNICSNQSFLATLVGAAVLCRGEEGMKKACGQGAQWAQQMAKRLTAFAGVELAFPQSPFFNEFVLKVSIDVEHLLEKARTLFDLHLGVNVSDRIKEDGHHFLLLSFFDIHTQEDMEKLYGFFQAIFGPPVEDGTSAPAVPENFLRKNPVGLPTFDTQTLYKFYQKLGEQNVSPDDHIYALGSCTMKYNPYINDYAASLPGFTQLHPQAPIEDAQGSLEILYEIQEMFKAITGLAAVTTQPVAGAQGELVGLKIFQAYFRERGELDSRKILIIPSSAHGTNPATATVAGLETYSSGGIDYGIVEVGADQNGEIDFNDFSEKVNKYGNRILGMMVTNPNTSGIFETRFRLLSDLIHQVGGLVYMDGANMNAIAGQVDLNLLGVDAVHNNLHKTWTIPHGGGGPGDAIVAVSEKLVDFLPGMQIEKVGEKFLAVRPRKSIGSFHRHFGNFAHKVRCYTYLKSLGAEGVKQMSAIAVLSARYLFHHLSKIYPTLPPETAHIPRMHEFIITLAKRQFQTIENVNIPHSQVITTLGKLFLDFGIHAPTVAFPEVFGLMIEPTESFTRQELNHFIDIVKAINLLISETPEVLLTVPHFTPIDKIDEVTANRKPILFEFLTDLPQVLPNRIPPEILLKKSVGEVCRDILLAHQGQEIPYREGEKTPSLI